jgi:hypothetical protein
MSGGLRLPVEQPIASASRGASYAGETIAMQGVGSQPIDGGLTGRNIGRRGWGGDRLRHGTPWRLRSWTFRNAYRANVGHRAQLDGLVVCTLLKSLALPRGIEPLFSP